MIYENIKRDMNDALKNNDKFARMVLADMVASIEKGATAGKTRVEITDQMAEDALVKYQKTVQDMIDTCPNTEAYAARLDEYKARMEIVKQYAPQIMNDPAEIEKLIIDICSNSGIEMIAKNKGQIMKTVMPILKQSRCDMKIAQGLIGKML